MKKKLLSLFLAIALVFTLAVPAAAAADDRLSAVTARVKDTLALDTSAYTDFYGNLSEDILAPTWYLEWYGNGDSLSISATEEGKILNYYHYITIPDQQTGRFAPSFPAGSREEARLAAQTFLEKVLTDGETITIEDRGSNYLGMTQYRFSGEILVNGLPAGMTYSISVQCGTNMVLNFYRDDLSQKVMGSIPSSSPAYSTKHARDLLRSTLSLKLEYVTSEENENLAVLRYLPEYGDAYYVDAATGKLINLSELSRSLSEELGSTPGSSTESSKKEEAETESTVTSDSLTQAEQAGVQFLEGVLDRDALDASVRQLKKLGLDSYSLSTVNYSVDQQDTSEETPAVTATMRYSRQVNGASWRRTVTVDAKTGKLIQVSSSGWLPEGDVTRSVDLTQAQKAAEAFLSEQCGAQFAKTELYNSSDALANDWNLSHSLTFAQKEAGFFYPDNQIVIGIDATDGSVSSYRNRMNDAVIFAPSTGIVDTEKALDAWLNTYEVPLSYVNVPSAIDYSKPEYAPLRDYGIAYLHRLVLGYTLEREDTVLGIDAATGQAVTLSPASLSDSMAYSDLDNHWAKEKIEALATYRVGYLNDVFCPDQSLTQLDLIALLASTEGYLYDPGRESAADDLYTFAFSMGLLDPEARSDTSILTRSQVVRLILDAAGYGHIAQLQGIFRTGFSDDSAIPQTDYGYIALAQGLGVVTGYPGRQFAPNVAATRAQAAVMLYNLMNR